MAAKAAARIRDLIMILNESDEDRGFDLQRRSAATLLLPLVALALIKVAPLDGGDEFLRAAEVIGVVGLAAAGRGHHRGVVPIVVP